MVSALLKDLTESAGEFVFEEGREVTLKGISGTQRVYEVDCREPQKIAPSLRLLLRFSGRMHTMQTSVIGSSAHSPSAKSSNHLPARQPRPRLPTFAVRRPA